MHLRSEMTMGGSSKHLRVSMAHVGPPPVVDGFTCDFNGVPVDRSFPMEEGGRGATATDAPATTGAATLSAPEPSFRPRDFIAHHLSDLPNLTARSAAPTSNIQPETGPLAAAASWRPPQVRPRRTVGRIVRTAARTAAAADADAEAEAVPRGSKATASANTGRFGEGYEHCYVRRASRSITGSRGESVRTTAQGPRAWLDVAVTARLPATTPATRTATRSGKRSARSAEGGSGGGNDDEVAIGFRPLSRKDDPSELDPLGTGRAMDFGMAGRRRGRLREWRGADPVREQVHLQPCGT
jgi:hypothetical protein